MSTTPSTSSTLVVPKNELAKRLTAAKIVSQIVKALQDLPSTDLTDLKINPELINYICNLVENLVTKKLKLDKKKIVLDVLTKLIPNLTEQEKKVISDIVEFLHANNLINKTAIIKYIGQYSTNLLKRLIPSSSTASTTSTTS
jgi:DNA replication initiation complex subunit (GINS family)